jgi:iron complex transport system substrate-binding protein
MMADALYLFPEAMDRVVGLEGRKQSVSDFLPFVDPDFAEVTVLEMDAGPEQVAPLQPDVIVMKSFMADTRGTPFEQVGIPVVYVDLETAEQYLQDMGTFGQLFADPARAAEIQSFFQERIDNVSQRLADLSADQKPDVLVLQYSDKGGEIAFSAPPASWIQTSMVEMAGGNPAWIEAAQGGSWAVVNFEQIAAWNPDKIFIISYRSDPVQIVADLEADPQWQALDAVINGEIYGFAKDFYSWDQPDTRWILGLTWMAGKLHPDLFADLDMDSQINDFFGQMYGMDQANIDANIRPALQGDVN